MKNVYITVVVFTPKESNNLKQPHAVKVAKQVDSDQGSKLTRIRAYLPLVVSFLNFIYDFFVGKNS